MKLHTQGWRFEHSFYYFIGLAFLVLLGFWPSYFSKFVNGTADFTFYFHFHAFILSTWILMLIVQPLLIQNKKLRLHRITGKIGYVIGPLIFVSIILLSHSRQTNYESGWDIGLFISFKDLLLLAVAFFIAFAYRHQVELHARGMISTGIICIEPALARYIASILGINQTSYLLTIAGVYGVLVLLIFFERNQKKGRWVFPLILALYSLVHSVIFFDLHFDWWQAFGRWFFALPLT